MLIKFSTTDDFKSDVEPAAIVTDSKQLVKRAGSERFKHVKVAKHQTPVHIIALGSYEGVGDNRNGDRFMEEDCRTRHDTFVKAGRAIHHNHKNKPSDPKYGDIYASDYNDPMKRIELMIGLDNDSPKNAETLQKLSEGKQVSGSMAASVPFDLCTICNHKAVDSDHRCEHIPSQLGEITKEGQVVAMINVRPKWFEYSIVKRGADRIAWSLNNTKTASVNNTIQDRYTSNLKQAQELYLPPSLTLSKYASSKRSLLSKLSKMEKHIEAVASGKVENTRDKYIKEQVPKLNTAPQLSDETIKELRSYDDHHKLLKALADKGIIFTPEEFFKYIFNNKIDSEHVEGMKSHLPSIYKNFDEEELHNEDFNPEEGHIPSSLMEVIKSLVGGHSLFGEPARGRIMRITIIKNLSPTSTTLKKESSETSDSTFDKQLALKYANYQLSALSYLDENDKLDDEMIINTLVQNRR